jgi:DNA-binding winged helix-turn-helix (wHTH) protein
MVFSSFRLDRRSGQLTRAGVPVALRPKTWAVLVHLAERPGVLVSTDELLDAVWQNVAVTPGTLTKSIGELRQAFGDDAASPHFIETVHRRGFRFIAKASDAAAVDPGAAPRSDAAADRRPLVGRAAELELLTERLGRAQAGARQIVFVTGPAGVGKTALVDGFLDSLPSRAPELWVERGACVEQHATREPYMPVLMALERLAHRPDADRLLGLLRRIAPTWLAQMPWLIGDHEQASLRESLWAARAERMLREFAALCEALTDEAPLVLVLEDLHWSDPSTVDLLSLLGERTEPARLLVIGTYRPAEVAVHEHVLSAAVHTLKLRQRCVETPVHELGEADVHSYLGMRFPGAVLPPTLARRIHAHTDGNPLFMRAVVEHLLSRGWILETAPGWSFAAMPETDDLGVPDDARDLIAAQLGSLAPADRSLLDAASVVGHEFAAQGVGAALRCGLDDVELRCETLAQPQRFLRFAGSTDWPDGTVALRYAFTHELYRQAVYQAIPAGTRQRLHRRVWAKGSRRRMESARKRSPASWRTTSSAAGTIRARCVIWPPPPRARASASRLAKPSLHSKPRSPSPGTCRTRASDTGASSSCGSRWRRYRMSWAARRRPSCSTTVSGRTSCAKRSGIRRSSSISSTPCVTFMSLAPMRRGRRRRCKSSTISHYGWGRPSIASWRTRYRRAPQRSVGITATRAASPTMPSSCSSTPPLNILFSSEWIP